VATEPPHHFDADEFREAGRAAVDWLADYLEHLGRRPVTSGLEPGDVRSLLPDRAPEAPEPFADLLADVNALPPCASMCLPGCGSGPLTWLRC